MNSNPSAMPTPHQCSAVQQHQPNTLQGIVQGMKPTDLHTDTQVTSDPADILCQGQSPETVIPLEMGRKFVVCIDDGRGFEQSCPYGLHYDDYSRRCERKLDPVENPCTSHPCLNDGRCIPTDKTSYQCQCPFGFDGKVCELDVHVCQTLKPCGETSDSRCQSFRLDAALKYVCICNQSTSYGLNCQEVHANPCEGVSGTGPLTFSEKGFAMCDGVNMWLESCPGGTIWDDLNKACLWPDMKGILFNIEEQSLDQHSMSDQTISNGTVNNTHNPINQQERPNRHDYSHERDRN
ncbi:hypothetical protein I4U23_027423 [Adineta vaga]|nr:hypothetical protein I4U23_027423 [Adineta vaga]